MNQGFFGFPLSTNVRFLEKVTFDVSGIYEIPKTASTLLIYAIGAGGGGQGGSARSTSSYIGGNGGAGGAHAFITVFVDEFKYFFDIESNINATQNYLPYKLVITIGAGGTGGTGGTPGTNGTNGNAGGDTIVSLYSTNAVSGNNIHRLLRLNGGVANLLASRPIVNGISAADINGGRGSSGSGNAKNVIVSTPDVPNNVRWNGGGTGGRGNTGAIDAGGSISLYNASLNSLLSIGPSDIPRKGGATIIPVCSGANCANNAPRYNICGSFSPGYGGGGGFGSTSNGSSVGGRGFRGSGGGGGGGDGSELFGASNGAAGGDGYVCIVALE